VPNYLNLNLEDFAFFGLARLILVPQAWLSCVTLFWPIWPTLFIFLGHIIIYLFNKS